MNYFMSGNGPKIREISPKTLEKLYTVGRIYGKGKF